MIRQDYLFITQLLGCPGIRNRTIPVPLRRFRILAETQQFRALPRISGGSGTIEHFRPSSDATHYECASCFNSLWVANLVLVAVIGSTVCARIPST
jgi:hypothetical protein